MSFWWMNNVSRANSEREQLGALVDAASWLKSLEISLGDGNLRVEFDIEHGANSWELVLIYPIVFPDAPPLVKTRDGKRISGHQYGPAGELCLEYRPDNWRPEVTGAMMVQSAYSLLSGENPEDANDAPHVPDGHSISIGQATRTEIGRFVVTHHDLTALHGLEKNRIHTAEIGEVAADGKIAARLMRLGEANAPGYVSHSRFPDLIIKSDIFVLRGDVVDLPRVPTPDDIFACVANAANDDFDVTIKEEDRSFYLLASKKDHWTLYCVSLSGEEPLVCTYRTLIDENQEQRIPAELGALPETKIGIVGCGSLGSKIAMQLTRTNAGSFLLIDDDVFFEGNLVRHTLTSSDVGFHKATALRRRMLKVNPEASVETRLIRLGGQESSASTVSAMAQLAECDLIVDATADVGAYLIIAAVAKRNRKPVVWGSVFAGGIGGIVGRAVPGRTPEPLEARRQVRNWCQAHCAEAQPVANEEPYAAHGGDGHVEIATDADAAVIASHVSRLATDTLTHPDNTAFPYSSYVLGMSKSWIFSAPFDTRPIDYTGSLEWAVDQEPASEKELAAFLKALIPEEAEGAT